MKILSLVLGCAFLGAPAYGQSTPLSRSSFITTSDGVRLHYLEAGSGAAILFVPGLTMPAEIWRRQIQHFARSHRVVAMDPRSQGESDQVSEGHYPERRAKDIKELIDALRLSPVVLVGWSMGGPESLAYVDQFGTETIRAVVLVDSVVGGDPNPARASGHYRNIKLIQANRPEWTRTWVRSMFTTPQPERFLQEITAASMRTPTNTMVTLIVNTYVASGDDRLPILQKLNRPVLYVASRQQSQAEILKSKLPAIRIELFAEAGHALFVDEADRFNKLLDNFIADL